LSRDGILFGLVALGLGLSTGYLMVAYPEGLNGSWPLGAALLVPALFALAGVYMLSAGLGHPRVAIVAVRAILAAFLVVANWAAFFTAHVPCRETVSFFGVPLLSRFPNEADCRFRLRAIIGSIDALILLATAAFLWQKKRVGKALS
jgi:hypothetical protein